MIAAYNIWDSPAGMPMRTQQITDTLRTQNADILCLQEVPAAQIYHAIADDCAYPFGHFAAETGLALFSRYPVRHLFTEEYAIGCSVSLPVCDLTAVSLHLPWKSALAREEAIVGIVRRLENDCGGYAVLAGDFNCSPESSVHRYLKNEQSLLGHDAYWFDLAESFSARTGDTPAPTLCFRENPRWGIIDPPDTIETDQRFDRILLRNPYPQTMPILCAFGTFGKEISPQTRLAPSDHWGVYADLQFPEIL